MTNSLIITTEVKSAGLSGFIVSGFQINVKSLLFSCNDKPKEGR